MNRHGGNFWQKFQQVQCKLSRTTEGKIVSANCTDYFLPLLGILLAIQSAKNYSILRKRGVTVRKTIDDHTYCIECHIPLLYAD